MKLRWIGFLFLNIVVTKTDLLNHEATTNFHFIFFLVAKRNQVLIRSKVRKLFLDDKFVSLTESFMVFLSCGWTRLNVTQLLWGFVDKTRSAQPTYVNLTTSLTLKIIRYDTNAVSCEIASKCLCLSRSAGSFMSLHFNILYGGGP